MTWLLVVMGLVALLAGTLAIPLHVRFAAALEALGAPVHRSLRLRWAFGLVDVALAKSERNHRRKKKARPAKPSRQGPSRFRPRKLIMNPAFWARLLFLLRRLRGAIHWRTLRFHARFGLDDPADTGRLWGAMGPLAAMAIPSRADVAIRPEFEGETLVFRGDGELRVIPLQLLWVVLSFVAAPATWRVLWPAWKRT